jgi:peptidoglycan/LPS O-acetylase OafA/YrhL
MESNRRLEQLDSIRGLAATSVILAHISIIIPSVNLFDRLTNTPLHLFWLGHESVILFFILSGFVLALPYYNNRAAKYNVYLMRRICRIWIPSICSLLFIILLINVLSPNGIEGASMWANDIWDTSISPKMLISHFLLLSEFNTMDLNPVIWSLIHEMRISIIFPLLMFFIMRNNIVRNVIIVFSIPIVYFASYYICLKLFSYDITIFKAGYSSYLLTPHYAAFFILGAIFAKYKERAVRIYKKIPFAYKIVLVCFGLIAYLYVWLVLPNNSIAHMFIFNDWAIALGSCIFIWFGLNSGLLKRILLFKPILFIGKIAYSVYLYHLIVIMALLYSLQEVMPVLSILVLSIPLTFGVAAVMYYLVEVPSVKLGRLLSGSKVKHDPGVKIKTVVEK